MCRCTPGQSRLGPLRLSGIDPARLELELTESAAVDSLDATESELSELRSLGVRCSIDDFGTGYCGLSYLSRLPVDVLKIDKAFVSAGDGGEASIITAIIALGHGLGLRVVAEGVETQAQLDYLVSRAVTRVLVQPPRPGRGVHGDAARLPPGRPGTPPGPRSG